MRAEMTSLFIGTNDVTPRSVPSLQFEVLAYASAVSVKKNSLRLCLFQTLYEGHVKNYKILMNYVKTV